MIRTARLSLEAATPPQLDAALLGPTVLGPALAADIAHDWPPEFLDAAALRFTRDRLTANPGEAGWWMYFVLLGEGGPRTLIGSAGFKGPPDAEGTVEVGYGIVASRRRRGYATEATLALVARAFAHPGVNRVIAETLPELEGSIAVLRRCGFGLLGQGSEPGVIRYGLDRPA